MASLQLAALVEELLVPFEHVGAGNGGDCVLPSRFNHM